MVGARGFEPPTPRSRTECSTRLSHAPTTRRFYPTHLPGVEQRAVRAQIALTPRSLESSSALGPACPRIESAAMSWYLWLVVGIVLAGLELTGSGGFYLVFFGLAAIIVGILGFLGGVEAVWLQWLVFTALSVVSLLLFRNPLLRRLQSPPTGAVDRLVGEIAAPLEDIPAGEVGRAELRGTTWSARNASDADIAKGRRCRVERVDGLMLFIVPE